MSQRITKAMLESALDRYVGTLEDLGMLDGPLSYQVGSVTYGNSWTLRYKDDGRSPIGLSQGFLGTSAREAYERLLTITRTLGDVDWRSKSH